MNRIPRRWLGVLVSLGAALALAAPASAGSAPALDWQNCGDPAYVPVESVQCATQKVPLDYDKPAGKQIGVAVAKVPAQDQANKIGSLFFNLGGPGGTQVDFLQTGGVGLFAALNARYDIVGFDPRGVGQSTPSIDCKVNQETQGPSSQPFPTPFNLDLPSLLDKVKAYTRRCLALNGSEILSHVSTADTARDMDVLRKSVGDKKLSYLGYSYGTFLGSTYAALFPNKFRALVLDGPLDADEYLSDPVKGSNEQTAAFEREIARFFRACAADQAACVGFGGNDPEDVFDALVDQANASPIQASGYTPDPRPIDGDDLNAAALISMYTKAWWPDLAAGLAAAAAGDGSIIRAIVDVRFYGRDPDTGQYDPGTDRFFAIYGAEANWPTDINTYVREGDQAWGMFNHAYPNHGYSELNFGLWPATAQDTYTGPFKIKDGAPTPLVVATTYDPATPYRGALKLVRELGNARLLTMRGDGHTAYGGNSACIDKAVNDYLLDGTLPDAGTQCKQDLPFAAPEAQALARTGQRGQRFLGSALHRKPILR